MVPFKFGLFCFVFRSWLNWSYLLTLDGLVQARHSLVLFLFIPLYLSRKPLRCVLVYIFLFICMLAECLLWFCEHIFLICISDTVFYISFCFFPFPQDWILMLHSCCYGVLLIHHIDSCILFHAGHPSHFTYAFFWCQTPGSLQRPLSQVMLWCASLSVALYGIGFQLGMILHLQGYLAISEDILSSDKWWKMLLTSGL